MGKNAKKLQEGYKPLPIPNALKMIRLPKTYREEQELTENTNLTDQAHKPVLGRIDHCQVPVKDLTKSIEWYKDVFGIDLLFPNNDTMAFFSFPENGAMLILRKAEQLTPSGFVENGEMNTSVFFYTNDMFELIRRLERVNAKVLPFSDEDPEFMFLKFFDPDGNIFGAIQNKK
jgi:catechol 2,3-dioxygenase-like lactoylglutathione lyase family enzyme